MRIVIAGIGKVGSTLAENLIREDHEVVVIDRDEAVLHRCEETMDVLTVQGSAASIQTLKEAEMERTDVLIAATASDELNILCCMIGKRLGAKYTAARIREPEYNEWPKLTQEIFGISQAINPERTTAQEISRLLRFPFANNIETFASGRVEIVEFRALEKDPVIGVPLKDLAQACPGIPRVLYAAVERDNEVIIPDGHFAIQPDDKVHVAADNVTITKYSRFLGKNARPVRYVMIVGGGRIGHYLAHEINEQGMRSTVIELNPQKAARLSEELPFATVLCGDGTSQELLEQENLQAMDALVLLTDRDEENLMTGLYAVHQGVPKVIVKNNRVNYADLLTDMGLDSVVSPRQIMADVMLRYVRALCNSEGTKVEKLYRLMGGRVEALEFIVKASDPFVGIPLKSLKMQHSALVAVIVRGNKVIVPMGDDHLEADDRVLIITRDTGIGDLNMFVTR